jgi:hypothetical protein
MEQAHLKLREEIRYFLRVDEQVVEEEEVVLLRFAISALEYVERTFPHVSPMSIYQRVERLLNSHSWHNTPLREDEND